MKNYGKFVVGLVLAWFIFALTAQRAAYSIMARIVSGSP